MENLQELLKHFGDRNRDIYPLLATQFAEVSLGNQQCAHFTL